MDNPRIHISKSLISWADGEEPFHFQSNGVSIKVGEEEIQSGGNLIVTNRRFVWIGGERSISFDYRSMVMHAITKNSDNERYIFVQLLTEEDEEEMIDTIQFIPEDESIVDPLFTALNEMSALNVDEQDLDE